MNKITSFILGLFVGYIIITLFYYMSFQPRATHMSGKTVYVSTITGERVLR